MIVNVKWLCFGNIRSNENVKKVGFFNLDIVIVKFVLIFLNKSNINVKNIVFILLKKRISFFF